MLPRLPRRLERAVWQSAQALGRRQTGRDPGDVVAETAHESRGFVAVGVFEGDGVRDQLPNDPSQH